ncbi:hypothetical protein GHK92_11775 [Nocardioides sp. dk4132]|uniref:hypothetical protein n=1 Tax=unclassified Nocardioides TaxID=2615069 RepID=UPI00129752A5|nr:MULTISPECIES: hypothetical protein [unclassified Nocardioides]MQW76557.1 hypothetical protein [Nocardioides sp. dk4132]QGA07185.1 hypothetical protein GFH29_07165 [Nocardioides sp. dk884]
MSADQVLGLSAGLGSAVVFGLAAVAQAHAVRRSGFRLDTLVEFVRHAVRDAWIWVVLVCYLVGFVLHAVAIWLLPLYLAQATVAMSLPVTALASRRVAERLDASQWGSVGLVSAGLVLLAAGSGSAGDAVSSWWLAGGLWAGLVVLSVLTLATVSRERRRLAGGLGGPGLGGLGLGGLGLGALAGLGYAGSALAVRGVGLPLDGPAVLCALAVPSLSLVAFWVYSRAMSGGAVAAASAPMIVGQTFIPAAVGILALGDGVREGWGWAVVAGLLVSTYGAVRLARAQARAATRPDPVGA